MELPPMGYESLKVIISITIAIHFQEHTRKAKIDSSIGDIVGDNKTAF
jgi:hypothetical protein